MLCKHLTFNSILSDTVKLLSVVNRNVQRFKWLICALRGLYKIDYILITFKL